MGKGKKGWWNEARCQRLRTMWDEGRSLSAIAAYFDVSVNAAAGQAHRMKLPKRLTDQATWTDELVARLKQLHREGLSRAEIAERMGMTRSTVIGKLHRLGLTDPNASPIRRFKPGKTRESTQVAAVPVVEVCSRIKGCYGDGEGVGMGDLRANQCRWPLWGHNEKPTFRCCGEKVHTPGASYCAKHQTLSEPYPFTWTPARVASLKALLAQGVTDPSELAHELKAPAATIADRMKVLGIQVERRARSVAWGAL
jgi:GcrA cell cycle regulator